MPIGLYKADTSGDCLSNAILKDIRVDDPKVSMFSERVGCDTLEKHPTDADPGPQWSASGRNGLIFESLLNNLGHFSLNTRHFESPDKSRSAAADVLRDYSIRHFGQTAKEADPGTPSY